MQTAHQQLSGTKQDVRETSLRFTSSAELGDGGDLSDVEQRVPGNAGKDQSEASAHRSLLGGTEPFLS